MSQFIIFLTFIQPHTGHEARTPKQLSREHVAFRRVDTTIELVPNGAKRLLGKEEGLCDVLPAGCGGLGLFP